MKRFFLSIAVVMLASVAAYAQNFGGAFEGMSNSDEPIQIEADRLEVADRDGTAEFSGNVSVSQGSTLLKTDRLKVRYSRDAKGNAGPGGNVRRIEALGRVAVRSNDQVASAERATVDMEAQVATLTGNVSVSQGKNIITGCTITIDMKTNNVDVQPCKKESGGRVKVLIDRAPEPKQ
jgi:lipopolysaccharide export system protein LptA